MSTGAAPPPPPPWEARLFGRVRDVVGVVTGHTTGSISTLWSNVVMLIIGPPSSFTGSSSSNWVIAGVVARP
jgi:hypothetical protein